MAEPYRVGIIGVGKPRGSEGATGFGMAHKHVGGYRASADAKLVAVADISEGNAKAFADQYGIAGRYTDYQQMLAKEKLDIISICTWPHLHAPMVIAAAEAGVKGIHCEKPMAPTFGAATKMVRTCQERKAVLSFNHQRRFLEPFRKARELLKGGAIGELRRLEAMTGNLSDWGAHWFDMMFMFNDETPVEWVIGQIDLRGHHTIFGLEVEGQGLAHWRYANGVAGLIVTGHQANWGAQIRLSGSEGFIEIGFAGDTALRMWNKDSGGWQQIEVAENIHGDAAFGKAVLDLIDAVKTGREPELSGRRALQACELTFATYESSRRRGRVDLPLTIEDSPLNDMLAKAGT